MPAFLAHAHSDESVGADVLVVPVASVADLHTRLAGEGRGVAEAAARAVDLGDFEPTPGTRLLVHARGFERFPRVLLLAVAPGATPAELRAGFAALARDPLFERVDSVAVDAGPELGEGAALADGVAAVVDGFLNGTYRWTRASRRPSAPGRFVVLGRGARALARVKQGIARGRAIGESVVACRELANTPANLMGPAELAREAAEIGREAGLKTRILSGKQLERERMEGILQVGGGSARPPQVAVLEYDGGGGGDWIALVGKGLVYDTGGLSIKPNPSMVEMKFDKCGACAVIGAIRAAAKLGVRQRIVAIVPAVENSISGTSYRPGDVIGSRSGKTIEVLNTDAEGRIVLADALDYAVTKYSPQAVIDCATLTGAALYALGDHACAVLGNDDRLIGRLREAGDVSGERAWQLPLWDGHRRDVDSNVADVRNTGAQGGGTIAGAAFLERFVGDAVWGHLDIAAVGRDRRDPKVGATGFGVRILAETLAAWPASRAKKPTPAGAKAKAGAKSARKSGAKSRAKSARKAGAKSRSGRKAGTQSAPKTRGKSRRKR